MNNLDIVLSSTNLCVVFLRSHKRDHRYANVSTCLYPFIVHTLPNTENQARQSPALRIAWNFIYVDYDRIAWLTLRTEFLGIKERMYEQSINERDACRSNERQQNEIQNNLFINPTISVMYVRVLRYRCEHLCLYSNEPQGLLLLVFSISSPRMWSI